MTKKVNNKTIKRKNNRIKKKTMKRNNKKRRKTMKRNNRINNKQNGGGKFGAVAKAAKGLKPLAKATRGFSRKASKIFKNPENRGKLKERVRPTPIM